MGEAVVVLAPDGGGDQQVERRHRRAPRHLLRHRQPLGVLVEHRVDDMHEGLVGGEEAVAAGQQVAFQPAFQRVLGEHLHHPAIGRQLAAVGIFRQIVGQPGFLADFVDVVELVGAFSSGPNTRKLFMFLRMMSRRKLAQRAGVFGHDRAGSWQLRRHSRGSPACAARLRSRPPLACGLALMRRLPLGASAFSSGRRRPALVEQLVGLVAAQPVFQLLQMRRVVAHLGERHLVRAPEAFHLLAVHFFRAGPALGRAQHDHRPARPPGFAAARASCWMRRISSTHCSIAAAIA